MSKDVKSASSVEMLKILSRLGDLWQAAAVDSDIAN